MSQVYSYLINVLRCPRCGESHGLNIFEPLEAGPAGVTHWAPCPATGQPVLLAWQSARPAQPNALLVTSAE